MRLIIKRWPVTVYSGFILLTSLFFIYEFTMAGAKMEGYRIAGIAVLLFAASSPLLLFCLIKRRWFELRSILIVAICLLILVITGKLFIYLSAVSSIISLVVNGYSKPANSDTANPTAIVK